MQVLEEFGGYLTNVEVYELLKLGDRGPLDRAAAHRYEFYLESCYKCNVRRADDVRQRGLYLAQYGLKEHELLQLMNLPVVHPLDLTVIVSRCNERLTARQQEEIVYICSQEQGSAARARVAMGQPAAAAPPPHRPQPDVRQRSSPARGRDRRKSGPRSGRAGTSSPRKRSLA